MKHSVILLVVSLALAGCGEQKADERAVQQPTPKEEPTAKEPTAKEPNAKKPTAKEPIPKQEPISKQEPIAKEPARKEERIPKQEPTPKEEPKPTPDPKPEPPKPAAPQATKLPAKDVVVMTASKLGAVTLPHKLHAEREGNTCTSCHHPSKPEKPMTAAQQACSDCHTRTATPPMKTRLQAAFHDPKAQTGTCIDCHKKVNASGKKAPLKCTECHKKG